MGAEIMQMPTEEGKLELAPKSQKGWRLEGLDCKCC